MAVKSFDIGSEIRAAVKEAFAELPNEQRLKATEEAIEKLSKIISGNGSPENGLVMKVDRNTIALNDMKEATKKRSDREWGIWAAILTSIAVSVLQLIAH